MNQKTVLIADDDASLCRVLTVRCKSIGLDTRTAHDAMHALVIAHKCDPDLIIMDISMPAGNGLSACEMLKNDHRFARVPIIVLSGSSKEEDIQRCKAIGVNYVLKDQDAWSNLKVLIGQLLDMSFPPQNQSNSPKMCG